jgi:hypothetical protein
MNWAKKTRIESRIGTATAIAALITMSGLVVPNPASATPTPLSDPHHMARATELSFPTTGTNIHASTDGPKCARLSVSYENPGKDDDDDDDNYFYYY